MDTAHLTELAERLLAGDVDADQFLSQISESHSIRTEAATIDLGRQQRCGFPEVIFAQGKSVETLCEIITALVGCRVEAFATRVTPEQADAVGRMFPQTRYNEVARTLRVGPAADENLSERSPGKPAAGNAAVITAGTSDLPVAEEARETLDWMGVSTTMICDVGVAGPHRLIERLAEFRNADAIIVVAGMEGALPSIVGGHVDAPVIAVPTSVGYGASFSGVAALLGMLNSCASNVVVVNIDAGFKAGYVAGMIARKVVGSGTRKGGEGRMSKSE